MSTPSCGVHIKVKAFPVSEKFYLNLGFKKVFEYGPDKKVAEDYSGAVFTLGNAKIEIANGHRAVKPEVFLQQVTSSKISLMISIENIGEVLDRCRLHNIPIAVPLRHYYWGTLEFVVKDPDGVVIVFITPYSPTEAKKLHADESWSHPST